MKSKSLIRRLVSNPIIQALVIYVSGAWVMIELVEYFIDHFNVNEQVRIIILVIMLCGLPIALFLAWFLSREKETMPSNILDKTDLPETIYDKGLSRKSHRLLFRQPRVIVPGIVIFLLLIVAGIRHFNRKARIRWANEKALPEIEQLWSEFRAKEAFNLVQKAEKYISTNPDFTKLRSQVTTKLTIFTDPPGADVYIRDYTNFEGEWKSLGKTPIDSILLPKYSFFLTKIEKTGYENVLAVLAVRPRSRDEFYRKLFPVGNIPPDMIYVEGYCQKDRVGFTDSSHGFFMDRYEVSNKKYKEFIDNGGYRYREYWKHEFIKDGTVLPWEKAMAEFTDKSGRPGPASWEAGDYPDGQDDYPVSGVSWYEAAAYAVFAGKSLPTSYHWKSGAGLCNNIFWWSFGSIINPISNFNGTGPEPVGRFKGINSYGAYDMAGNVREWCWNEAQAGRIIRGGAWNDYEYMYSYRSQLPPFDRSLKNGFRLVQYLDKENIPGWAFQQVEANEVRDYYQEEPVSEEIFRVYKHQFLYDKTALDATIEDRDEHPDDWILEKITFNAAYADERVIAYLYLPKNADPPYQTLVFFPGSGAIHGKDLVNSRFITWFLEYIVKNGRALIIPVYKGTFERNDGLISAWPDQSHQYTDYLNKWVKDFSRTIDYLETRPDINKDKIGFYGHSWGGWIGGIIPAIEERCKVNILVTGGFWFRTQSIADPLNYVTRIKIPTLMLNGKYDIIFTFDKDVKPFFDLLGTPEKDKRLRVYDTDHYVPKNEMIKETLNWLDKYFGPVSK
jgi:dienelactone hydrolase